MASFDAMRLSYSGVGDSDLETVASYVEDAYIQHGTPSQSAITKLYDMYVSASVARAAEEAAEPSPGLRAAVARLIGGPIITFIGKIAIGAARLVSQMARTLIFSAGRFIMRSIVMPVIRGALMMMGPWGLGIAAAAGLGYFVYKSLFSNQPLDSVGPSDKAWESAKATDKLHDRYEPTPSSTRYDRSQYGSVSSAAPMAYGGSTTGDATAGARLLRRRSADVKNVISEASRITGVPESVLTAFAYKESSFNPNAKAPTSTAKGLFQFRDSTWKYVLKRFGERYGIPMNANPYDPYANAVMGGAYLKHEIYPQIQKVVKEPSATDLYFGHFMGPAGGRNWLKNYLANPNGIAAHDWSKAAAANRWVYYDKSGRPKTYDEIYRTFARSFVDVEAAVQAETNVQSTELNPSPGMEVPKPAPKTAAQPESVPVTVSVVDQGSDPEVFSYNGVAMVAN